VGREVDVTAIVSRLARAGFVETQRNARGIVAVATATGSAVRKHT
jgi:hypothetical protein